MVLALALVLILTPTRELVLVLVLVLALALGVGALRTAWDELVRGARDFGVAEVGERRFSYG